MINLIFCAVEIFNDKLLKIIFSYTLREKCSNTELFRVRIFLHSN